MAAQPYVRSLRCATGDDDPPAGHLPILADGVAIGDRQSIAPLHPDADDSHDVPDGLAALHFFMPKPGRGEELAFHRPTSLVVAVAGAQWEDFPQQDVVAYPAPSGDPR